MKWVWRYNIERDALWRRLIDAKYGSPLQPLNSLFKKSKGSWTYIAQMKDLMHDNIIHVIGNGENTSFWSGLWAGSTPFKIAFPRLFALSGQKEASIADCWNYAYQAWDLGLRQHLNEAEIDEWTIMSTILISPASPTGEDTWKWSLDKSCQFYSKSITHHLASGGNVLNTLPYIEIFEKVPFPRRFGSSYGRSIMVVLIPPIFSLKRPHGLHRP